MNSADDILDPSKLSWERDFETQVEHLLSYVRLTATEVRNLRNVFADLESALQSLAPGLQVHPFGSIVTGLGIRTSDVDCYIELPFGFHQPPQMCVIQARNILKRHYKTFVKVFAITTAKVPIVKFLHTPTNCNCDINFKSPAGVRNSELISFLLHMDRSHRAIQLAIIVKYWSKVHRFTGTNLLASYGLTLMVIFYLQLMNLLPSVHDLQKSVPPYIIDGWNTSFDTQIYINDKDDTLYDLLGGFFKCYANMNLEESIISPYMGRVLNKNSFKNYEQVPSEFVIYKHNLLSNICPPLNVNLPICVQDPFEHARNCSSTANANLTKRISAHFQFAAKKFDEVPPELFLQAILQCDTNYDPKPKKKVKQKRPIPVIQNKMVKPKNRLQQMQGLQNNFKLFKQYEMARKGL